jgi:hypothetical protein
MTCGREALVLGADAASVAAPGKHDASVDVKAFANAVDPKGCRQHREGPIHELLAPRTVTIDGATAVLKAERATGELNGLAETHGLYVDRGSWLTAFCAIDTSERCFGEYLANETIATSEKPIQVVGGEVVKLDSPKLAVNGASAGDDLLGQLLALGRIDDDVAVGEVLVIVCVRVAVVVRVDEHAGRGATINA